MLLNPFARKEFERSLIQGLSPSEIKIDCEQTLQDRWMAKIEKELAEVVRPIVGGVGRRLNNFCLGSDPEFVFINPGSSHKTNAVDLGLKPALAAGCDQNRRLAELRGWPTKSVTEHLAGILTSLRWMYRLYPECRGYYWRAGAWHDGDGIGGHVHFGRKRPNRAAEVAGLDGLASVLRNSLVFPNKEWDRRQQEDAHHQIYGKFGDTRIQLHGYEYRTLPSWLCNPAKAFVVLTTAKLAVLDPSLTATWFKHQHWGAAESLHVLRHLARYYAGRDDDAMILKHMLSRPIPKKNIHKFTDCSGDFRSAWGFKDIVTAPAKLLSPILADCVKPLASEVGEIEDYLVGGEDLTFKENPPTFRNTIPDKYMWMYSVPIPNIGWAGVGDLCHNLVMHQSHTIALRFDQRAYISADLFNSLTNEEKQKVKELFPEMRPTHDLINTIMFTRNMTTVDSIQRCRTLLLKMNLFPIWTVESVEDSSYIKWAASRKASRIKPRIEERML